MRVLPTLLIVCLSTGLAFGRPEPDPEVQAVYPSSATIPDHLLRITIVFASAAPAGVLPVPGRGTAHDRKWRRQDHQHRLDADLSGRHSRAELYRVEERDRRADQIAGHRVI